VKHLTDNGFRRIGFINYKTRLIHLNERTRGYHEALRAAGLPQQRGDLRLIEETRLETEIQGAMDALLDPRAPVDAIFFSSSNVAIEGLSYLRKKKIAIPDELGVVCFDETKAYDLFPCPITYIRQPLAGIGQTAVKMLLRDIGRRQPATRVVLETEMIVKESSYPNHLRRAGTKKKK
jgi:LacI family transcriptional regulator